MDRVTLAKVIQRAVAGARTTADDQAARLQVATRPGLLPPSHYRHHVQQAEAAFRGIQAGLDDLIDVLAYYGLLWPEAHDDAGEDGLPGDCACGRRADACPARRAAEAGELTWTAEDGRVYALSSPGSPAEATPSPEADPTPPPEDDPSG